MITPSYGTRALSDLAPSILTSLDVPGSSNPLEIPPVRRACLLVVDGLGAQLLDAHSDEAPFLAKAAAARDPITTGFPSTTAASLTSIGTGLPPAVHGLVGYTVAVAGYDRPMNCLHWELYGVGPKVDLSRDVVPEKFQPERTAFERAAGDGVAVTTLGPSEFSNSGLTRAGLRGGRYRATYGLGDISAEAGRALSASPRALVYAYEPTLDTTGHVRGTASDAWRDQLAHVDALAQRIAARLPRDAVLIVTGDHGMVDLKADQLIDLDQHPELRAGVRFIAGEARARHVHAHPGAARDVLGAWSSVLGDRMTILTRDAAIAAGWFGSAVADRVRERIGDVVAVATSAVGVVQKSVDPRQAELVGHHGALTEAEALVPLALIRP